MSTLTSAGLARGGAPRALDGKVALITGSTEGRGLAIAAGLAAHGAMIALTGPGDPVAIRSLCQSLGTDFDVPVWHDHADMADAVALMDMVERIQRGLGSVDILVIQGDLRPGDPTADRMRDLAFYFHAIAAVLPGMRRRGFGRIISIAPTVDTAEHARAIHDVLTRLTEATAWRMAGYGITCHALFPRTDGSTADARAALAQAVAGLCGGEAAALAARHTPDRV